MAALAIISTVGCALVFTARSAAVQNASCILCGGAFCAIIVDRLSKASDVVDAALHLADEIARLGGELPGGPRSQRREPHLAVVRPLPGQRAAAGQGAETPWYEDRQ